MKKKAFKKKASKEQTRREFIKTAAVGTAAGAAALMSPPFVRTSHSAGKLEIGLWDHWVPGANDGSRKIIEEWGQANGVEVSIDYITSAGSKLLLTSQAEGRSGVGHDIFPMPQWFTAIHQDRLEPVDDVVNELIALAGPFSPDAEYLGKLGGRWLSVPGPIGSHTYPMVSRVDYFREHAGVDLKKIFPAGPNRDQALVDSWNYDNFLLYAEKLHAADHPFGNPIAVNSDSQDWLGPLFASFGSKLVDGDANITADSDETRQALDYMKRLTQFMPPEIYAWDDASNNRWIISGRGSAILNPPSAWTVAKRDRPDVAAQIWHHDTPRGPKGRFRGSLPFLTGIWKFSKRKSAAKALLLHMCQKEQIDRLISAAQGFDVPLQSAFADHTIWKDITPPQGGQYNYPLRGDEQPLVSGFPAPPEIAGQIYIQGVLATMVAMVCQADESFEDAISWTENELEGFMRG